MIRSWGLTRFAGQFTVSYRPRTTGISSTRLLGHNSQSRRKFFTRPGSHQQSQSSNTSSSSSQSNFKSWLYPTIPVSLGLCVLGGIQYRRISKREQEKTTVESGVVIEGPWQVHVLSTLPLRSISRLWGWFNSLTIPTSLRSPGFKLYSWIFGCNLDEMADKDLTHYPNLASFFYRELEDGARPIDKSADIVCPSDGKVLAYGIITEGRVEHIKGKHYTVESLLGNGHQEHLVSEDKFAKINFINYSLDKMLGDPPTNDDTYTGLHIRKNIKALFAHKHKHGGYTISPTNALYYCVIYLAPGDYHRFHSPTSWLVEKRRHFVGELFSVSPIMTKWLPNLFTLNERVALLGSWKHGFFGMVPVGATNVGSIVIDFDPELRTNEAFYERSTNGTFTECTFTHQPPNSKQIIPGHPLSRGTQMGGFKLGSTVVLVFEAPKEFEFEVQQDQKVKMGSPLGRIKQT